MTSNWFEDFFAWLFGLLIFGFLFPIGFSWLHNSNQSGQYNFSNIIFSADALVGCVVICASVYMDEATARPRRFLAFTVLGVSFVLGAICAFQYVDLLNREYAKASNANSSLISSAGGTKNAGRSAKVGTNDAGNSASSGRRALALCGGFVIFVTLFAVVAKVTERARTKIAERNLNALESM